MALDKSVGQLNRLFLRERLLVVSRDKTPTALKLKRSRSDIADHVREIGKGGDLNLILAIERRFLENDLQEYANSPAMKNSLKTAMQELQAAEKSLPLVNDPTLYKAVDDSHGHPKSRTGGLPNDAMRRFCSSNAARLLNMDKSRLDGEEKKIVDARKLNMRAADKVYTLLQRQALGLGPDKSKAPELAR